MVSSRVLAVAFIAAFLVCGSVGWREDSDAYDDEMNFGYGPKISLLFEGTDAPDPLDIDLSYDVGEMEMHPSLEDLKRDDGNSLVRLAQIREVHIEGYYNLGNVSLLERVFDKLENLTKVVWDYGDTISAPIIRSLERNSPSCKLYYTLPGRVDRVVHEALFASPNLYAIKAEVDYGYEDSSWAMMFILTALFRNHNIRELDLTLDSNSCETNLPLWAFDFASYPDARVSPLEVLKLSGYSFDERADGGGSWEYVQRDQITWKPGSDASYHLPWKQAERDNRSNLEAWMQLMDWSHIHTLDVRLSSNDEIALLRGDALPSLKNLTVGVGWSYWPTDADILDFVTHTAQPLEALSLKTVEPSTGDEILTAFFLNPDLVRNLKEFSFGASGENGSPLSEANLRYFMESAPKLENVDLNLRRQGNMSMEAEPLLSLLSSPTIKQLTLRFTSPDNPSGKVVFPGEQVMEQYDRYIWRGEEGPDPLINRESVPQLFKEMREQKKGADLESLEFVVGHWDERDFVSMVGFRGCPRVGNWRCFLDDGQERCQGGQRRMAQ
jgi:hypothetical protein